jgi:hypothetical protein
MELNAGVWHAYSLIRLRARFRMAPNFGPIRPGRGSTNLPGAMLVRFVFMLTIVAVGLAIDDNIFVDGATTGQRRV